ncbi:hypothetical protein [Meiothermus ruber]|nr:hypothetical protein [Meiothermus ruber]
MEAQSKTPAHREAALIADGGGLPLALYGHRVGGVGGKARNSHLTGCYSSDAGREVVYQLERAWDAGAFVVRLADVS